MKKEVSILAPKVNIGCVAEVIYVKPSDFVKNRQKKRFFIIMKKAMHEGIKEQTEEKGE